VAMKSVRSRSINLVKGREAARKRRGSGEEMENLLLKHNESERADIIKEVRRKYQASRDYYQPKHDLFRRLYKIYRAKADDAGVSAEWDIKIALGYGIVENIVSRISQTVLGKLSVVVKPKRDTQHEQAGNFHNMVRSFFSSPRYRIDYTNSTRERVICGLAWEFDEWVSEYEDGWRWAKGMMDKIIGMDIPLMSSAMNFVRKVAHKGYSRVRHKFPVKVGYSTRFPSIFNVFPQPGVLKIDDLKWIIESVEYRTVDDLKKATYTDDKGEVIPVYDLREIEKIQVMKRRVSATFPEDNRALEAFRQEYSGISSVKALDNDDDIDAVHLLILRTNREQLVIANGIWLIQHVKDLYHKPGLKVRARVYTHDAQCIYGMGALEPVMDSLAEFDDTHSMSMQNWFREINRMFAYNEEAFPYPEDFDNRAGGKVRVKGGVDINTALMPLPQNSRDTAASMLTIQSAIQGAIEGIVSIAELSPGVAGSRPYHSTYGGLMEIQQTLARRFAIMMNVDQCETMKQMDEMYWIYEQFMFEPMAFNRYSSTGYGAILYKREDIDTDGEGFLYLATDDPSFGDNQVQRNQNLVLLSQAMNYASIRQQLNKTEWKDVDAGEIFEFVLESFGKQDTSKILKFADGSVDPDTEYSLMLQGVQVQTHPKENASWHLIKHVIQLQMAQSNEQMPANTITSLINHTEETRQHLMAVVEQPEVFAQQYQQEEAMRVRSAVGQSPVRSLGQINLGQNLPAAQGAGQGAGMGTTNV